MSLRSTAANAELWQPSRGHRDWRVALASIGRASGWPLVLLVACNDATVSETDAGRDASSGELDVGLDTPDAPDATAAAPDAAPDSSPAADRTVTACDEVVIEGAASMGLTEVAGWPLLDAEPRGADLVFRAPPVARPTYVTVAGTFIRVEPRDPGALDIVGLSADCGSFQHGVASGDPRPDAVTLWTRWTPPMGATTGTLEWTIASDRALSSVVASGTVEVSADDDWTTHVEVTGLLPGTTYHYRFRDASGERSALGRTRTAPVGDVAHARFAVMSCSSLFSGWFNAYRRLAERDDIDLVIHLGDYIYDSIDPEELVRVPPSGTIEDLVDLASHRRRHALYLSDPDLRLARQAHPWLMIWNNHDIERSAPDYEGGVQAFREWTTIRADLGGPRRDRAYQVLRYGTLADVYLVDMYTFRGRETLPGSSAPSVLGAEQYEWLTTDVRASTARWRIFGMQEVLDAFGPFSGWQDFPEARSQLIAFFRDERIGDNLFLSGDSHFTVFQDVVDVDPAMPYDPVTHVGAIGGEFLPTSITRGNFDEQLRPGSESIIATTRASFLRTYPFQVDLELTSHGYGIVDLDRERIVTEVWYSPILGPADSESFGLAYALRRGEDHYDRTRLETPTR